MFKFIAWVCGGTTRHWREIRRYERGLSGRIGTLIAMIVLAGCCALSEWLFLQFITDWIKTAQFPILSLIGLICLMGSMIVATVDFCSVFAYVAFKNAFAGMIMTAVRIAEIYSKKRRQKEGAEEEPVADTEIKTYKALDIFIGIMGIVCAVFAVLSMVIVTMGFAKK